MSAASMLNCITCYAPTEPMITSIEVTPNPTDGADSVSVKANTDIVNPPKGGHIMDAHCYIEGDLLLVDTVKMKPSDGKFDEAVEELEARLYVGNLDTGSVRVYVGAVDNFSEMWQYESTDLEITE